MFKTFNLMMHLIACKMQECEVSLLESSNLENQMIYHTINMKEWYIFNILYQIFKFFCDIVELEYAECLDVNFNWFEPLKHHKITC